MPDDLSGLTPQFMAELTAQMKPCARCGHAYRNHWPYYYGGLSRCDGRGRFRIKFLRHEDCGCESFIEVLVEPAVIPPSTQEPTTVTAVELPDAIVLEPPTLRSDLGYLWRVVSRWLRGLFSKTKV